MLNEKKQQKEYSFKESVDIALKYSNNDTELAKKVVSGTHQDILVLKIRFKNKNEDFFGLFSAYFASEINTLSGIMTIASHSPSVYNHKPFDPWKTFEETINREWESEINKEFSEELKNKFIELLTPDVVKLVISFVENEKYSELNNIFVGPIEEQLNIKSIYIQIEVEKTTSVELELGSNALLSEPKTTETEDKESEPDQSFVTSSDPYAGNVIIGGKLILAPVKGKDINQLTPGDTVKVLITEKTKKGMNIANKLEALNDEKKIIPIGGEVESYKKTPRGHEIYVTIAPFILVRIIEEENIKVAIVSSKELIEEKSSKKGSIFLLLFILTMLIAVIWFLATQSI